MNERQELHCHSCNNYVQFDLDMELNGNHVLECPKCGHEHCRVVENGKITGDRWSSRNGNGLTFTVTNTSFTTISTFDTYSSNFDSTYGGTSDNTSATTSFYLGTDGGGDSQAKSFLHGSWMNTTSAC